MVTVTGLSGWVVVRAWTVLRTQALPVLVNDETVSVHGIRPVGGVIVVARMDDPAMPPASLAQR